MGVSTCTCRYPLVFPNLTPFFIYILYLFILHIILYRIILEEEKIKIKKKGSQTKTAAPSFLGLGGTVQTLKLRLGGTRGEGAAKMKNGFTIIY